MVMRRKQNKENRHCRVNMIKEQRITIYEHRIFNIFYGIIFIFIFLIILRPSSEKFT